MKSSRRMPNHVSVPRRDQAVSHELAHRAGGASRERAPRVVYIYRYGTFQEIKMTAHKNQKWYGNTNTIPLWS
eukprot:754525-Prymnesium_polylepis.1